MSQEMISLLTLIGFALILSFVALITRRRKR
ncbi:LPXTG cell wall anchor domain-containing protein [Lacticaseibacillus yichunensis]|uniref:LPXTG cell wall anchor domain-containing protein n=1 Tax=Lacticaseibacillus yichunensis TaxID=2486015 RepID=A0ABW4CM31_9LACO|nr:LPXTG cell wall anchor domain-containing protein [Lacticaseibacillus yichunensis]